MSQDFLHNIFSRGSIGRTDSPVVSIGGISSNSGTLTYDVAHFDQTGNLLVSVINPSSVAFSGSIAVGAVSQSGSWTVAISGGTVSAIISAGTVTSVISGGTVTAIVSAGTVTAVVSAGTVTAILFASTVSSVLSGTDPVAAADGTPKAIITDSLGKQVVLPGAVNDLHLNGQAQVAQIAAATLIPTPGAGRRIALQSILVTGSASQIVQVIISGGPSARTFGFCMPTGGFGHAAGGAPLYITSASTNLSVAGDVTASFNIFASGYSLSN